MSYDRMLLGEQTEAINIAWFVYLLIDDVISSILYMIVVHLRDLFSECILL